MRTTGSSASARAFSAARSREESVAGILELYSRCRPPARTGAGGVPAPDQNLPIAAVVIAVAADDVDEPEHPVVEEVRAVHADDQVAAGLEEPIGDQRAVRGLARRGDGASVDELLAAHRHEASGRRPHAVQRMRVRVGGIRVRHDDDVTVAVLDHVQCIRIRRAQVARVIVRIGNMLRIVTGAEELAEIVAGRVLADPVERRRVAAAVYLEGNLATLGDGGFLRCEVVQPVRAGIRRTADAARLQAPFSRGPEWTSGQNAETNQCVGRSFLFLIALLCRADQGEYE